MTRKDDHLDSAAGNIKPKDPKDPKDGTAMYEAEHESEQPSNEERELERLFADDLGLERLPAPPDGLADRIKAEIPADLGWKTVEQTLNDESENAESSSTGVVVPFYRHRGFLAMAATLVLAVALWTLVPRTEMGVSEDSRGQTPSTQPASLEVSASSAAESDDIGASQVATGQTSGEDAEALRSKEAPAELRDLGYADQNVSKEQIRQRREALQKQLVELERKPAREDADGRSGQRSRRVPIPDPTPDEPEIQAESDQRAVVNDFIIVTDESPKVDVSKTTVGSTAMAAEPKSPPPPPPSPHAVPSPAREPSVAERYQKLEEKVVMDRESPSSPSLLKPSASLQPPNDEAYDAMFFDSAGVNPFVDTEDDALSTFGLDVDTASYTVVRRYLQDGNLPPEEAVRVEEMLNFFDYGDAPPAGDEVENGEFALHADVAPSPWAPAATAPSATTCVRFGVKARDRARHRASARAPHLRGRCLGLHGREDRLGLVKRSLGLLLDNLQDGDQVALVVYGSQGRVLLPADARPRGGARRHRPASAGRVDQRCRGPAPRLRAHRPQPSTRTHPPHHPVLRRRRQRRHHHQRRGHPRRE